MAITIPQHHLECLHYCYLVQIEQILIRTATFKWLVGTEQPQGDIVINLWKGDLHIYARLPGHLQRSISFDDRRRNCIQWCQKSFHVSPIESTILMGQGHRLQMGSLGQFSRRCRCVAAVDARTQWAAWYCPLREKKLKIYTTSTSNHAERRKPDSTRNTSLGTSTFCTWVIRTNTQITSSF